MHSAKVSNWVRAIALVGCIGSTAAGSASPLSSVESTIVRLEKDSWKAWQDKDVAFWQRHLSSDHFEMDGPGPPQDKNFVVKAIRERTCTIPTYKLDQFTFRQFDRDTAALIYHASQEIVCGDRHIEDTGWVTSIYELRHGRWENVLFEHMAAPAPSASHK